MVLNNYHKSGKSSLNDYFDSLDNNQILDLAGLSLQFRRSINDIRNYLISTYGSDLGVEGKDFYLAGDKMPFFLYDSKADTFTLNENYPGTDYVSNLGGNGLYNYKVKNVQKVGDNYIVSYYGLFETSILDLGPSILTNNKNIERYGSGNYEEDGIELDDYLSDAFNNNKNDFLVFEYTFKKNDNNYFVTDFNVK